MRVGLIVPLVALIVTAGCGGGDATTDDSAAGDASGVAAGSVPATAADAGDGAPDAAGDAASDAASDDAGDDAGGDAAPSGGGAVPACDALFSAPEIEAWFGETAELEVQTNDDLGQLICTWSTIEDSSDLEDMSFGVITAQVFSGDPIPASSFVDPSVFDEVTMLDGIGDLAFYETSFGINLSFLDEPWAGSLAYSQADLAAPDAPHRHSVDEVVELFRTFHDRVVG